MFVLGAFEVGPVAIALDADHERAHLVVGADRAADKAPKKYELAGRSKKRIGPIAVAEGPAAVDAE